MHLELGPVPSKAVLAWLEYASSVISAQGPALPPDVADQFEVFLYEWQARAQADPVFIWDGEVRDDVAEYLTLAFYRLAKRLADRARRDGVAAAPAAGDEFYGMLVQRLLDALAEGGGTPGAEFSDHLRNFWPGFDELP